MVLESAVKTLIVQEVRLLQLGQTCTPPFMENEMCRSLQEAKRQVAKLVRRMPPKERNTLIKKMIRQSLDEEIDRAVEVRKTRCLRCVRVRYVDEAGRTHRRLPEMTGRVRGIGCEKPPAPGTKCQGFIESPTAASLEDYLNEMTYLYELKEMFDEMEEVWKDYLTR